MLQAPKKYFASDGVRPALQICEDVRHRGRFARNLFIGSVVLPNPVWQGQTKNPSSEMHRVLILSNPIQKDIAIPVDDALCARFDSRRTTIFAGVVRRAPADDNCQSHYDGKREAACSRTGH
ncbi:hypothetical protein [Rhizobium ruizarguesonis]|uniref:hypothetical protein n=1 Tax=Rhizobium ruizarguesonis TaxID=2081791 RepID=UPI001953FC7B|nr:hypothetical protein [Rhizobium ruizarguesonis]